MWDILLAHPAANAVGAFAALLGITWPLYASRRALLMAQGAAHAAFAVHFWLLGAPTAALMNVLGAAQTGAALPLGDRPGFRRLYLAILPVIALGAALTWHGWASLFSALGLALFSLARYQLDTLALRMLMVLGIVSWFAHNWMVMSIPAMTTDMLSLATSLMMIAAERRRRKQPA
ncbi:MAG: YgjV family protein [Alphaproteobacteria bacterium]|nr:YgjV family protein [Alphaproteobacteria bacterium]